MFTDLSAMSTTGPILRARSQARKKRGMAALWPGYSVNSPRHGSELSSPINRAPSSATSKTGRSSAGGQPGYFDCRTLVAVVALAASLAAVLAWIVAVHDIDKKWVSESIFDSFPIVGGPVALWRSWI